MIYFIYNRHGECINVRWFNFMPRAFRWNNTYYLTKLVPRIVMAEIIEEQALDFPAKYPFGGYSLDEILYDRPDLKAHYLDKCLKKLESSSAITRIAYLDKAFEILRKTMDTRTFFKKVQYFMEFAESFEGVKV